MNLVPILLVLWGIVVTTMVALLVLNATCCNCNQARTRTGESASEKSRREKIFARAQRLHPYIRASGSLSALMTLGLVGAASWAALESLIR